MLKTIFALIFIFFSTQVSFAATPFIWQQTPQSAPMIFPQRDGQTKAQVIDEYFKKIQESKSVSSLVMQEEIKDQILSGRLQYQKGTFKNLEKSQTLKPRFVVVTNELRELYAPPYGKRIMNVIKRLESMGAEVIALPVVHDLTLNAKESKEFRAKIIDIFDAQLILGGADIDPYLYGEKLTYAKGIVRKRDISELKFVRQFINAKKGMNFGICRGHQMCAVANHKKLIQDIQIEEGASPIHINGNHLVDIDNSSEIFSVFDKDKLMVNSLHHQAVLVPDGDNDYKVIASSLDENPIVEAISFKNGKGITLQFHPELMFDKTGDKILKQFIKLTVKNKKLQQNPSQCLELIKSFL